MTIRKGVAWGRPAPLPPDGVVVAGDAEARSLIEAAWRDGRRLPVLGLLGGDLCRTLGGTGDEARLHSAEATTFPCDLGVVSIDGVEHCFVAHLVARRGWWRGRAVVAANAAWLGEWNVAPRSHPDDGILEVLDARVLLGQRRQVRAHLALGDHLPHPGIRTQRVTSASLQFERPLPIRLDGELVATAQEVIVRVEPDALTVVV